MKKTNLLAAGFIIFGIAFTVQVFAFSPALVSSVSSIPYKTTGDYFTSSEFNTILSTLKNIYNKNGNIGIGVASPDYKLDVQGDIHLTGDIYQGGSPLTFNNLIQTGTNTDDVVFLNGAVGIGTDNPSSALDVDGNVTLEGDIFLDGSNSWMLHTPNDGRDDFFLAPYVPANNDWAWDTFTIDGATGNVGIGTTSPTTALTVWNGSMSGGIPSDWGGGIHAWDIYANGTIGAGTNGNLSSYISNSGVGFFDNRVQTGSICDKSGNNCSSPAAISAVANGGGSIGSGQVWRNVSGSRSHNVWYRNTTGKPIQIYIRSHAGDAFLLASTYAGGGVQISGPDGDSGTWDNLFGIIPNGHYYRMTGRPHIHWAELR